MLLKHRASEELVEILDLTSLSNPSRDSVRGRLQCGEELPDPETFSKSALCFPSGEDLPRCWVDPHYRDEAIHARHRHRA